MAFVSGSYATNQDCRKMVEQSNEFQQQKTLEILADAIDKPFFKKQIR